MLLELFRQQRSYLDHFFDNIDLEMAQKILDAFFRCKGLIVFTGIGKSGIIAEKLAMTMISTGTKALYLPAVNALHGDIGIVSQDDIIVLISKSGETDELLQLIPYIRKKKASVVSFVSNAKSRLASAADYSISLPVEREICPFDLAPTTSAAIQLLFGDILAIALMKVKQFSLEDFAINHPSGLIGKKISLKVEDVMIKGDDLPLSNPNERLIDVLVELSNKRCGLLLVTDQDAKLQGIFTDGDLRRSLQKFGSGALEKKLYELMTPTPKSISKGILVWEAMQSMQENPLRLITACPVLEEGKVIGLIRMHEIIQAGIS
jgi:arabinose-5-phosphate isomerase